MPLGICLSAVAYRALQFEEGSASSTARLGLRLLSEGDGNPADAQVERDFAWYVLKQFIENDMRGAWCGGALNLFMCAVISASNNERCITRGSAGRRGAAYGNTRRRQTGSD